MFLGAQAYIDGREYFSSILRKIDRDDFETYFTASLCAAEIELASGSGSEAEAHLKRISPKVSKSLSPSHPLALWMAVCNAEVQLRSKDYKSGYQTCRGIVDTSWNFTDSSLLIRAGAILAECCEKLGDIEGVELGDRLLSQHRQRIASADSIVANASKSLVRSAIRLGLNPNLFLTSLDEGGQHWARDLAWRTCTFPPA